MENLKGWHRRGCLPHYDGGGITQFITFRLHDSLPSKSLETLKNRVNQGGDNLESQRYSERFLDYGCGECYLEILQVAEILVKKLFVMHD